MIPCKSLLLAAAGVAAFAGQTGLAQPAPNVLTVNIAQAADSYYKVQDFEKELEKSGEQVREKVEALQEERQLLVQEFEELADQAESEILTEQARNEAAQDAIDKRQEVQQKEQEIRQFVQQTQRTLQARQSSQMEMFLTDISEVVEKVVQERGATLAFDTSGFTRSGMPAVLYADPAYDVTPEVIRRLNADRPAESSEEGSAGSGQ